MTRRIARRAFTSASLAVGILVGCSPGGQPSRAPAIVWERSLDFRAVAIVPAGGREYLLVGSSPGDPPTGAVVARVGADGREVSRRRYELPPDSGVVSACEAPGGGCVVLATTGASAKNSDALLLRIDSRGEPLWQRTYGGSGSEWVKNVVSVPRGGFAVGGSTVSFGVGRLDFYLFKTGDSGELEWERTCGAEGWEGQYENSPAVTLAPDGGYLLVGSTDSPSLVGDRSVEVYAVRTDSAGRKLEEWVLGDSSSFMATAYHNVAGNMRGFDVGVGSVALEDGYILGGIRHNYRPGVFFYRLSGKGEVLWEVTRGDSHGNWNLPMLLLSGGKIVAGTGYWENGANEVAAYILQVDTAGQVDWELRDPRSTLGRVLDLEEADDGGILVLAMDRKRKGGILARLGPR